ncbi:zinc ABC transporter ATP-binding protein AztA [Phreatobacter sp. AB_2022a]|uniref:zinc ABC transporter ATP-binding protein AztA n=1 Tax=Phreatobacter sp. AB_2022a TaxID=3003134 RepID=UPI00228764D9|nr:zinc ABC transporter ATP-binding protein AztA [Phreatobacter sp. AB_2022a]MCZ0735237.1 zinc ABC transporter ATP-binding protein AztA [Phreatobacter sp. AB_2022a]
MSMEKMPPAATSAVRFRNLTLGYDRHPAVHHLDGTVAAGAMLAVVGPNGAGKSTLLKGIAGALKPLSGAVELAGGRGEIAYLPQAAEIDRSFPISVFDMVAMGFWRRSGLFGGLSRADREAVHAALAAVGLTGFESRAIGTLSGGQLQRMLFARLLVQDARLILLDEPFSAIDARTTADLIAIVCRWHAEKRTVIAVLHDMETVRQVFPQTLLLARRPIAWGATAEALTADNLAAARHMTEAFDDHAAVCAAAA